MPLFPWLLKRMSSRPRAHGTRAPRFGLRRFFLEQLEDRCLFSTLTTLASFGFPDGENPYAGLVMDSSGNLYGTAISGGAWGDGAVFELAKGSSTFSPLASFNGTDGANPYDGLIVDSSGNLYGTTYAGGAYGDGTVFELAQGSGTITTLASFNITDGQYPRAGLIMDGSGNLYGTTYAGGTYGDGTVFELAQGSGTISALASFDGTNGAKPYAGVILDASGNLYGTTYWGGAYNDGTVFELAQGSGTITTLASFNNTDGASPSAGLILDASGNLYGTTYWGGAPFRGHGTVFELAQGSCTITTLAAFNSTDGAGPEGLIRDNNGNLFGTTVGGGASSAGTVFELVHGTSTITTLASFDGADGSSPIGLIMDGSGNLYSSTEYGGPSGIGTVFELAQGSGTISVLASLEAPNGSAPYAGLIRDSSGNGYGTTSSGGASNAGTLFELAKGTGTLSVLASFNGTDGANPDDGLIMDSSGNLYGTTAGGGISGSGTIFELVHGSGTITTLASFDGTNGARPVAGLIRDSSGNLYGTTNYAGADGYGTVFELAQGSGTITTLASFDGTDGANSYAGLLRDSSGNLYGTTSSGGASNDGTIFKVAQGSSTITVLASFNGSDGSQSDAGLMRDSSGNLYGTTNLGGANGEGTVFELARGSGTITVLASFNGTDGANPQAGLIRDSNGNLYGTTVYGGASNFGTLFELAPSGTITVLTSFNGTNGAFPRAGVVRDSRGNLYGTTNGDGSSGGGTAFELSGAASADVSKVGLLGSPNPVTLDQTLFQSGFSPPASPTNGDGLPTVAFHQDTSADGQLVADTGSHEPGSSDSRRLKALKSLTPSFVDTLFSQAPSLLSALFV
jgi:uncharacterized repeat protein (TIGR03803 family)